MLTLGAPLGAPGKDKIVHRGVDENGRQWAVAQLKRLGAGAVRKLTAEVSFLRRAAAAGLAPQVSTELSDLPKGRLVTELCDGGTLKDVLRRQDGALRRDQQQRLVEILEALGGPSCAMCHGDLGNPLNYVEGKDGVLRVIDFGFAHDITEADRHAFGNSPKLNLFSVGSLVWGLRADDDDGTSLWKSEPSILIDTYRRYKREVGVDDPFDADDRRRAAAVAQKPGPAAAKQAARKACASAAALPPPAVDDSPIVVAVGNEPPCAADDPPQLVPGKNKRRRATATPAGSAARAAVPRQSARLRASSSFEHDAYGVDGREVGGASRQS